MRRPNRRKMRCLITAEELKILWFRDKAYLMKKPSIDRKNNEGDYTFKNCQYLEHKLNSGKKLINAAMRKNWSEKSKEMWKKKVVRKKISNSAKKQMLKQWRNPVFRNKMVKHLRHLGVLRHQGKLGRSKDGD